MPTTIESDSTETFTDPLLDCLVILTQLNHNPFSPDALRAGLPLVNHRLTPNLFVRAAERAGFTARILKRPLARITNLVLPVVLILKNNQACILNKINDDYTADIILSDSGGGIIKKPLTEIIESYSGYAIFVNPAFKFESRSENSKEKTAKGSWFWGTLWRYRNAYTQVAIAALLINLFALVTPLFIMNVYDRVVPNNAFTTLWVLVIGVLLIFVFDFLLRILRSYLIDVSGKKVDVLIASDLFQQVLGIQMNNKPSSVGAFVNNLREFEVLRDFFTSATLSTIIDLPFVLLYFVLIAYIGGALVWVPAIIVPILLLAAFLIEKPMRSMVLLSLQGASQKHAVLVEAITGLETVKCLSIEGQIQRKWEQYVGATAKFGLKARFLSSMVVTITNYAQQLVMVFTVLVGVFLIHDGVLTLGGLIACNILAGRILAPLAQMANILTRYQQAKLALDDLNKVMSMPQERPLEKRFLHRPQLKGNIEFDNVTFKYPDQQILALDKLSFKMQAGERVGIIGHIGSGKSTIERLLLNLYQPQSGSIRIDGIDLAQIDPIDLRRNMGYVPQDSLLFFGNVRSNISVTMPWATDAAITRAAELAGVDTFVNLHPSGYDMVVGERGEGLSGGQRQAIAIARALLADPPIWLFDEPTSAMDNLSEMQLVQRLSIHLKNKTMIVVTHRTSLLPLVDRILVIDKGRLALDGPRDKVIAYLAQQPKPIQGPETQEKK